MMMHFSFGRLFESIIWVSLRYSFIQNRNIEGVRGQVNSVTYKIEVGDQGLTSQRSGGHITRHQYEHSGKYKVVE